MAREKLISIHVVFVMFLHHALISIATNITEIRLSNGIGLYDGRVEILMDGTWGTICNTSYSWAKADALCHILFGAQHRLVQGYNVSSDGYGAGTGPVHIDNLDCKSWLTDINDCTYSLDVSCTDHSRDVSVVCSVLGGYFNITNTRLVNGTGPYDGRIEIYVDGNWGTIDRRRIDMYKARIICKMHGASLAMYFDTAIYGEGTGPILISDMRCIAENVTVKNCNVYSPYRPYSSHLYDLSIVCTPCGLPEIYNGDPVAFNGTELTVTCHTGFYPTQIKMKCLDNDSWSEEQRCTPYHAFPLNISGIRLFHGAFRGRVEILVHGTWGTICDTNFDSADGRVICKMFRLKYSSFRKNYSPWFGHKSYIGSGPIYVNKLNCTGTESHINFCSYEISNHCTHYDDVRIFCTGFSFDIRLSDGPSSTNGRVELKILNTWGTVCGDGFGMQEADTICSMLGYSPAITYYSDAHYGRGKGLPMVYDLSCEEDATHINNCTYGTDGLCYHPDVSVVCTVCTSFDNCTTCPSGKYGSSCQQECGLGCQNHTCDITSGSCTCSSNFQGNKCDQCVDGKYGNRCEIRCPAGCANDACNSSGDCYSCKTGFIGNMCTQCEYGKYGTNCDIACPFRCTCKDNGDCHGCKAGFTGNMCTQCEYGKYGTDCNIPCPFGCSNDSCNDNGDCYSCKDGFTGSRCDQCADGMYGINCKHDCSKNCALGTCIKTTGVCNDGCRINYYGEQCNMTCAPTCLPDGEDRRCFHTNGSCVKDCHNGYYGDMCQDRCSENCINVICSKANGGCKFGCVDGFKGKECTQSISEIVSDSDNTADFLNVGTFIGVSVGSVATLLVVGIIIMIRRHLRHGHLDRRTSEHTYELRDVRQENVTLDTSQIQASTIEHTYELADVEQDNARCDDSQNTASTLDAACKNSSCMDYEGLEDRAKTSHLYDRIGNDLC